jgi:ABC-type spermidine/putrescine transport system permease subunit I
MKMALTTTFVSLLAVGGVAYASRRRRARHQRFAFLRKHLH